MATTLCFAKVLEIVDEHAWGENVRGPNVNVLCQPLADLVGASNLAECHASCYKYDDSLTIAVTPFPVQWVKSNYLQTFLPLAYPFDAK